MTLPSFHVIGAPAVAEILADRHGDIVDLVADTYRLHGEGATTNPDSYFLRFADRPTSRIIALPARVQGKADLAGIKWIASFPENHDRGLPRASAVVILNDMATGMPFACVEGSAISATRTAASAALAAGLLHPTKDVERIAVIGSGPIARTVLEFLAASGWRAGRLRVHDLVPERAAAFADRARERGQEAEPVASAEDAIRGADLVVLATTAAEPYLHDASLFTPGQTVLNVSLRDLGVPVILSAQNVLDDVDHCLKAATSPHLAEQAGGSREFVAGTIADVLAGRLSPDPDRVRVFSPFGLGVLDLALTGFVFDEAVSRGLGTLAADFFGLDGS
ncbi:2,3-diaminopropionate biosynthesis protein SbnB [Streptomyces sp. NPDC048255]|uniref:2,3-diaminopropionate biosynthesis protein SbnB n=1 Tax=Streptomyces sp. NPDC048255 TaxID=3154713 RepID=UPI0033D16B79